MRSSPVYSKLRPVVRSPALVLLSPRLAIPPTQNPKQSPSTSSKLRYIMFPILLLPQLIGDTLIPWSPAVHSSHELTFGLLREWRERRDADISRRAEISEEKKEATVKKAQEDIDDFYVSYNNKTDKLRAQTRAEAEQFLASREDTSSGGTSWERIAKLVDISGKGARGGASGSGKERFRELLLDLKKDEKAPGASGI